MASTPTQTRAADLAYRGLIELDYGSSLAGIPRHSRYFVDLVLNGDVLDTNHAFDENAFVNQLGQKGITTYGVFENIFRSLRFTLDPSGPPALELAGLEFNYNQLYGDFSRVVDVNQPPPPRFSPCDSSPCVNEHIMLNMRSSDAAYPIREIYFNLYNSSFYNAPYASRQLLLDVSQPGDSFTFQDLFLHGPETLHDFMSQRDPSGANLVDGVLLAGPGGTLASGRFLQLRAVPAPLPLLGGGMVLAWSRRLRRRLQQARS
ncbi:MAG: hypothetical protein VKO39_05855 [Cyanobacteriota bacterium]|nr:hypothetical protein [Cyanobacteriota bacterium]